MTKVHREIWIWGRVEGAGRASRGEQRVWGAGGRVLHVSIVCAQDTHIQLLYSSCSLNNLWEERKYQNVMTKGHGEIWNWGRVEGRASRGEQREQGGCSIYPGPYSHHLRTGSHYLASLSQQQHAESAGGIKIPR